MHAFTTIRARHIGLAAAGVLMLTACGGGDATEGEETNRLTISELMGAPDYESIDYEAQQRGIEEAVAVCMSEQGWEYVPVDYGDMGGGVEYTDEDELERINREGFGIAYWTLNSYTDESSDAPIDEWVDPNSDYVMGLSTDEQTAYYEALYGTDEENAENMVTEIDPETGEEFTYQTGYGGGCYGNAYKEAYGDDPTQSPEYWTAIEDFYAELAERVEADPRVIELNEKWSACMKDEGLTYENQTEFYDWVYTDLQGRHDDILGDDFYPEDPFAGWSEEEINDFYATATEEELNDLWAMPELTDDQRTQLEALLAEEIEIALAEHTCSKDLNDKMNGLYSEIEEQYALEHEDELKELAASLAGGE